MSDCSVIILAAGKGTRMKSSTPKVLHQLCGRTLLGHAIVAAEGLNPQHIVTVVRHQRDAVSAEALQMAPGSIIADQDDIPGTGRAVQCGLETALAHGVQLGSTVLVTSGDVPLLTTETLQRVLDAHKAAGAAVTVVTTIAPDPTGYGRIVREGGSVTRIVEHRDASPDEREIKEINAGIYAFDTEFLTQALGQLDTLNDQGEVYLTDTISAAVTSGKLVLPFVLEDSWQAEGCNDLVQLAQLRTILNARLCEAQMLAGARIVDPATTSIDVDVVVEPDAIIEPFTVLRGRTRVKSGATVTSFTVVEDETIPSGDTMVQG